LFDVEEKRRKTRCCRCIAGWNMSTYSSVSSHT